MNESDCIAGTERTFCDPMDGKRRCVAEICVGVHEEMIRLVSNLENNISIIYFAFAEKSGMSFSCFACVFVRARS